MQSQILRQVLTCLVALTHVLTISSLGFSSIGWAQDIDADPPQIELQTLSEGIKGEAQMFSATVTDEVGVSKVTLYYRFANSGLYEAIPMDTVGETGEYVATVSTSNIEPSPEFIQYYVEARDKAGNRNLRGFAFDPEERELVQTLAASDVTAPAQQPVQASGLSTGQKITYGLLGIVLIGVLASAAGGGGGSDSGPGVPVTIEVQELP